MTPKFKVGDRVKDSDHSPYVDIVIHGIRSGRYKYTFCNSDYDEYSAPIEQIEKRYRLSANSIIDRLLEKYR